MQATARGMDDGDCRSNVRHFRGVQAVRSSSVASRQPQVSAAEWLGFVASLKIRARQDSQYLLRGGDARPMRVMSQSAGRVLTATRSSQAFQENTLQRLETKIRENIKQHSLPIPSEMMFRKTATAVFGTARVPVALALSFYKNAELVHPHEVAATSKAGGG